MKQQTGGRQSFDGHLTVAHTRHRSAPLAYRVRTFIEHRHRSVGQLAACAAVGALGVVTVKPSLEAVKFTPDLTRLYGEQLQRLNALSRENVSVHTLAAAFGGRTVDYGTLSRRVITTVGVNALVDAWQNLIELEILKYHGVGTGTNAESSSDTALQTESTTALNPDSTRATGSLTEGAGANIFRTVGTVTFDGSAAITAYRRHRLEREPLHRRDRTRLRPADRHALEHGADKRHQRACGLRGDADRESERGAGSSERRRSARRSGACGCTTRHLPMELGGVLHSTFRDNVPIFYAVSSPSSGSVPITTAGNGALSWMSVSTPTNLTVPAGDQVGGFKQMQDFLLATGCDNIHHVSHTDACGLAYGHRRYGGMHEGRVCGCPS